MDSAAPSILPPGFESKAHHLHFYQLLFGLYHLEKTKIDNHKEAGIGPFIKHKDFIHLDGFGDQVSIVAEFVPAELGPDLFEVIERGGDVTR